MGDDRFAGGDQVYLRKVQYRDSTKLAARANLHMKYRTAALPWFVWLVGQVRWPPAADVLEVGCGPGWLWAEGTAGVPVGSALTLTDLSSGMVGEAVARVGEQRIFRTVRGGVADAERLPFQDASFDVAVANHMLYHVGEPACAVAELARVLRPTGVLVAAANGRRNLEDWSLRSEIFGTPPLPETTQRFGRESGEPMLRRFFDAVTWHDYRDELLCSDPEDVVAFLMSCPPGEDASAAQRRDLSEAVRARFAADTGTLRITKQAGLFLCAKPAT